MRGTRIKTPRAKCYVCKLSPDYNHWKYFEVNGVEVPVCQKLCAVRGGFIEKPIFEIKIRQVGGTVRPNRADRKEWLGGGM